MDAPVTAHEVDDADAPVFALSDDKLPAPHGTATRYAVLLAAGIWLIAAAVGLLSLLLGPSSVDNVEVRRIVPYAIALGAVIGAAFIVAAKHFHPKSMRTGATSATSATRCRVAAVFVLVVIAAAICALVSLAPGMRTTTFICLETLALAAWPVVFAVILTIGSRR